MSHAKRIARAIEVQAEILESEKLPTAGQQLEAELLARATRSAAWIARSVEPDPSPWITVEDRLPDEWQTVLVVASYSPGPPSVLLGYWNHDEQGGRAWSEPGGYPFDFVTHWMPLPSPPEANP